MKGGAQTAPNQAAITDVQLPSHTTNNLEHAKDSASEFWGGNLFVGLFQDLIKTLAKVLSGSMLSDITKQILRAPAPEVMQPGDEEKSSFERIIYDNYLDSFLSRFVSDFGGAAFIRFSKAGKLGKFIKKLPSEALSQLWANPVAKIMRALTSNYNSDGRTASTNHSSDAVEARKQAEEQGPPKWLLSSQKFFEKYLKTPFDHVLSFVFGIKAGKAKLDENGNVLVSKSGKIKRETPTVNWTQFWGITGASFVGSLFLPRKTATYGFDDIAHTKGLLKNIWRMFTSTLFSTIGRIDNTIWHKGVGLEKQGYSYEAAYRQAVTEKTLVPFVQYLSAALGAGLSKIIPLNGASLSVLLQLPLETISTFLTSGLVGLSEKDRVPEHWRAMGIKFWYPGVQFLEKYAKPIYDWTFDKLIYRPLGLFNDKKKKLLPPQEVIKDPKQAEKYKLGNLESIKLFLESSLWGLWFRDLPKLLPPLGKYMKNVPIIKDIVEKELSKPDPLVIDHSDDIMTRPGEKEKEEMPEIDPVKRETENTETQIINLFNPPKESIIERKLAA